MDAEAVMADLLFGSVQDPFPFYTELREYGTGVLAVDALNAVAIFRYDDIIAIARDHVTFSNDTFAATFASRGDPDEVLEQRFTEVVRREVVFQDPPEHSRLRRAMAAAFSTEALARWKPIVRSTIATLTTDFAAEQQIDLVTDFVAKVPVAVLASLLGVPRRDLARFEPWCAALTAAFDASVRGQARQEALHRCLELVDYLEELVRQRRARPRHDITSIIAGFGVADACSLSERDVVAQLVVLLGAGQDTTANLVANGMNLLLDEPWVWRHLGANREDVPVVVEELLRLDPPLHADLRIATQDVRIGEVDVRKGAEVWLMLAAGNRDPRRFVDPDTLRLDRTPNRHLSFMHGRHYCVGAPLARLEGAVVLDEFARRFPHMTRAEGRRLRRTNDIVSRGWRTLPVCL